MTFQPTPFIMQAVVWLGTIVNAAMLYRLRSAGRQVDVVLVKKKMNWTMKHVQRLGAKRMVIVGAREWENGCVRVKDLDAREEADVKVDELQ